MSLEHLNSPFAKLVKSRAVPPAPVAEARPVPADVTTAIDFSKLNDPVFKAAAERAREEEQRKLEDEEHELKAALERCLNAPDQLPVNERNFINSCRNRLNTCRPLSQAQQAWLLDIAQRIDPVADEESGDLNHQHTAGG